MGVKLVAPTTIPSVGSGRTCANEEVATREIESHARKAIQHRNVDIFVEENVTRGCASVAAPGGSKKVWRASNHGFIERRLSVEGHARPSTVPVQEHRSAR